MQYFCFIIVYFINKYNLYKEIEKDIILSSLEELNIKDLIKELVEKFK